jgi:phosphoribosyl 1,2-cyclic phosphodiesterase
VRNGGGEKGLDILGAHATEAKRVRLASLLVNEVLAIDVGGPVFVLSLSQQRKIKIVLLSHHHFDHTRDLIILVADVASW